LRAELISPDAYSDVRYAVYIEDKVVFRVGFKLQSLVNNVVYVTLEPIEALSTLRPSHFRWLRREFDRYSNYNYFCQVTGTTAARFAEFFGFKQVGYAWGRIHMTREAS
jgi:hypothetical protein